MPINDPGNAATAPGYDRRPGNGKVQRVRAWDDDARRRLVSLFVALASGLVLLPAIVAVTLTGEWRWLTGGLGAWLTLCIVGSSIAAYRYGKRP